MSLGPGILALAFLCVLSFDSDVGAHTELLSPQENGRDMATLYNMYRSRYGAIVNRIVKRHARRQRIHDVGMELGRAQIDYRRQRNRIHGVGMERGRAQRDYRRQRNRGLRRRWNRRRNRGRIGRSRLFKYCSTPEILKQLAQLLNDTGNADNYRRFVSRIHHDVSTCDTTNVNSVDDEEESSQSQPLGDIGIHRRLGERLGRNRRRGHRRGHRIHRHRGPHRRKPFYCRGCAFFRGTAREDLRQIVRDQGREDEFSNLFRDPGDPVDEEEEDPVPIID